MDKIKISMEILISALNEQLQQGIEYLDARGIGEVADIIKDLSETEKNCYKACYYKALTESMGNPESLETVKSYSTAEASTADNSTAENLSETITTMRDLWEAAAPPLRRRMKNELTRLVNEMNT